MTQTISATNKGDIYEIARKATHEAMRNCRVSDGTRLYYIMVGFITEALAAQRERDAAYVKTLEDAIRRGATWFREYAEHHREKEAHEKADRNEARAKSLEGAIRQQDKGEPG
jgi:hypothetical protein